MATWTHEWRYKGFCKGSSSGWCHFAVHILSRQSHIVLLLVSEILHFPPSWSSNFILLQFYFSFIFISLFLLILFLSSSHGFPETWEKYSNIAIKQIFIRENIIIKPIYEALECTECYYTVGPVMLMSWTMSSKRTLWQ